jgi:cell division protein FtsB
MRLLALGLALVVALLQYPLWFGKGGWLRVRALDRELRTQHEANEKLRIRNAALDAEVRDLKLGLAAIEERARAELGMIRQDEIFFEIVDSGRASSDSERLSSDPDASP